MTAKEILIHHSLKRISCREGIINLLMGAAFVHQFDAEIEIIVKGVCEDCKN